MRNSNIKNIFRNSNTLIYVALSMLSLEKDSVIPELLYTINREDLLKLVSLFGGEKLYIPEAKEFTFAMRCAVAGYYYKCQNQRWQWIQKNMELSDKELELIREKVLYWTKNASKEEINVLIDFKEPTGKV